MQVCVSRIEPFCPGSPVWVAYSHTCSCGSTRSAIWQLRPAGGTAANDLSWEDRCSSQVRLQCYCTHKGPEVVLECAFLWRKYHSEIRIIWSSHCKDSQNWIALPALQGKIFFLPPVTLVLRSLCKELNIPLTLHLMLGQVTDTMWFISVLHWLMSLNNGHSWNGKIQGSPSQIRTLDLERSEPLQIYLKSLLSRFMNVGFLLRYDWISSIHHYHTCASKQFTFSKGTSARWMVSGFLNGDPSGDSPHLYSPAIVPTACLWSDLFPVKPKWWAPASCLQPWCCCELTWNECLHQIRRI